MAPRPRNTDELVSPPRYTGAADIEMRLVGSIIKYREKPVRVVSYDDEFVFVSQIGDTDEGFLRGDEGWVHSSSVYLDLTSLPLGYVQTRYDVFHLARKTLRRQKQGVHPDNVETQTSSGRPARISTLNLLNSRSYVNLINHVYDPARDSFQRMMENVEVSGVAINRKLAITRDEEGLMKLKHMGRTIGFILPGEERVTVPRSVHRNMDWMKAYLGESGLDFHYGE